MRTQRLAAMVVIALSAASRVSAAPGPLAQCEAGKLGHAGRAAAGILACHARAAGHGEATDPECLQKRTAAMLAAFAKADAKATVPCPKTGEGTAVGLAIDQLAQAVTSLVVPPVGPAKCTEAKLKAAGIYARASLVAEARHAKQPESMGLADKLSKAEVKLIASYTKADLSPGCTASGGATSVAGAVRSESEGIVDLVRGTLASFSGPTGPRIGASLQGNVLLTNPLYRDTAARHFDMVTTWGETVWENVEPSEGAFNLAPFDAIVEFAEEHAMTMKGTLLVWNQYVPAWLSALPAAQFEAAVENHINTLVGGYAGRIQIWDVVNEVVMAGQPGNLRPSPFLTNLGPNYVAEMFTLAHQADPSALLFLNEFGAAEINPTSNAMYAVVQDLLLQGVPIHGVGVQLHDAFGGPVDPTSLQANLQRFADLGLRVHVSELEVNGGLTREANEEQRARYRAYVAACRDVPGCDIAIFGFTDNYIWIGNQPMIFDYDYLPKAAFFGVRDALAGH